VASEVLAGAHRRPELPVARSGYGTTSVALNSTVKCSADRSATATRSVAV